MSISIISSPLCRIELSKIKRDLELTEIETICLRPLIRSVLKKLLNIVIEKHK